MLKRKKIFINFFLFFLAFNFLFSFTQFVSGFNFVNSENEINQISKKYLKNTVKKPNIYFFILDAMMPLNEFENFYEKNLLDFENFYNQKKYSYYKQTENLYPDTTNALTALFFLEEIFIENENQKKQLKENIYRKFPKLLQKRYDPKLISELNNLGYEFKWIGNSYANCSRYITSIV